MGQGVESAAQSSRFFLVRRAGLSRLPDPRKKRTKKASPFGGSLPESPRFLRGGETRARNGGGWWLGVN